VWAVLRLQQEEVRQGIQVTAGVPRAVLLPLEQEEAEVEVFGFFVVLILLTILIKALVEVV